MRDYVETLEWLLKTRDYPEGVDPSDDDIREAMADNLAARIDNARDRAKEGIK